MHPLRGRQVTQWSGDYRQKIKGLTSISVAPAYSLNSLVVVANILYGEYKKWNPARLPEETSMKRLALALAAVVVLPTFGCNATWMPLTPTRIGSGLLVSQDRPIGEIDQIVLQGAIDIEATIGAEPQFTIEADDNLLDIVSTEVQGKKLVVS